jgi:hypothetical protein
MRMGGWPRQEIREAKQADKPDSVRTGFLAVAGT